VACGGLDAAASGNRLDLVVLIPSRSGDQRPIRLTGITGPGRQLVCLLGSRRLGRCYLVVTQVLQLLEELALNLGGDIGILRG